MCIGRRAPRPKPTAGNLNAVSDGLEPPGGEEAESLARIEAGGIPVAAERRLGRLAGGGLFTSGLSVAEFALAHELGVEPLGQVMGGSIHQVGYQFLPGGWYGEQVACELDAITHAWDQARRRSLDRLAEEARDLGADAVVGVRVQRGEHDWAAGCVDYVVTGTAVRSTGQGGWPTLTDLSVQDYHKLVSAGYQPVGLVAATSAFFVSSSSSVRWSRAWSTAANQELTDYTQGMYAAREIALRYISSQADASRADGVVGVRIEQQVRSRSFKIAFNSDSERSGLEITFHAVGTAIRATENLFPYPPETTVSMGAQ